VSTGRGRGGIRIKLADVARLCGVSVSTVSRVLNGKPGVDSQTRERILSAVEAAQFDPAEPILIRHRANSPMLAFLIPDAMKSVGLTTYVYLNELKAIREAAEEMGFGLFVGTYRGVDGPTPGDRMLNEGAVAGAVITRTRQEDLDFREFRDSRTPFVVLNRGAARGTGFHSVFVDDARVGSEAADHFLKLGHTRIALLQGARNIPTSYERNLGFRQAITAAGLPWREELAVETDLTEGSARQAMAALLELPDPPTAVVCLNDTVAIAAMEVARERGLHIPGDLAVMGFDDTEVARHVRPALTSMRVPWAEMARTATFLLRDVIRTPDLQEAKIQFRTALSVRESCGARIRMGSALAETKQQRSVSHRE
jgi:LacI family transcriptional regulator